MLSTPSLCLRDTFLCGDKNSTALCAFAETYLRLKGREAGKVFPWGLIFSNLLSASAMAPTRLLPESAVVAASFRQHMSKGHSA